MPHFLSVLPFLAALVCSVDAGPEAQKKKVNTTRIDEASEDALVQADMTDMQTDLNTAGKRGGRRGG